MRNHRIDPGDFFTGPLGISDRLRLTRFVSMQPCYSLADRTPELELVPLCLDQGIGIIPYYPLAGGILTGKYASMNAIPKGSRADKDPNFARRLDAKRIALGQKVSQMARDLGHSPAVLSLAWLIGRPAVSTVSVGTTRIEQLEENLKAAAITLDDRRVAELDQISEPFRVAPPFSVYRLP